MRYATYQECFGVCSSGYPVRERIVPFLHYAVVFLKLISIIVFQMTKDREDANIERELRRRRVKGRAMSLRKSIVHHHTIMEDPVTRKLIMNQQMKTKFNAMQ